ncbi:hypothetical protein RHODGE_RHODGE_03366 [Rhodoplanes serenus]|uniref:Uncharacterized protein n=1 Tax=Rhodoplanes serenus TaxID=200615 RepID=A0A447CY20_9BRAD|nr:hypothetical protein [Rhodoplanes serenus]VCU10180.1 hypothetical protein RHODGE_RHODGE_03366 [Rhodoplanes serenus]
MTKTTLSPRQTLIVWGLLVRDGGVQFQKDIRPEPSPADRRALEAARLITVGKRTRQGIPIALTDHAWSWAADNLGKALTINTNAGTAILQGWLTRLDAYMRAQNVALADILGPQRPRRSDDETPAETPAVAPPSADPADQGSRARIRAACLDLAGGALNTRVLLRDLRAKLPDIDRATLDAALKRMEQDDEVSLMPLDNRIEIGEADRAAALHVGREPRHIVWVVR